MNHDFQESGCRQSLLPPVHHGRHYHTVCPRLILSGANRILYKQEWSVWCIIASIPTNNIKGLEGIWLIKRDVVSKPVRRDNTNGKVDSINYLVWQQYIYSIIIKIMLAMYCLSNLRLKCKYVVWRIGVAM